MGERGPAPKRNQDRVRRHRDGRNIEAVRHGRVAVPRGEADWNPHAKKWYGSLKRSAQSAFYEPSDWATAKIVAQEISDYFGLDPNLRRPAQMTAILKGMDSVMSTHQSRLRSRVEVQLGDDDHGDAKDSEVPDNVREFRAKFAG